MDEASEMKARNGLWL